MEEEEEEEEQEDEEEEKEEEEEEEEKEEEEREEEKEEEEEEENVDEPEEFVDEQGRRLSADLIRSLVGEERRSSKVRFEEEEGAGVEVDEVSLRPREEGEKGSLRPLEGSSTLEGAGSPAVLNLPEVS